MKRVLVSILIWVWGLLFFLWTMLAVPAILALDIKYWGG